MSCTFLRNMFNSWSVSERANLIHDKAEYLLSFKTGSCYVYIYSYQNEIVEAWWGIEAKQVLSIKMLKYDELDHILKAIAFDVIDELEEPNEDNDETFNDLDYE